MTSEELVLNNQKLISYTLNLLNITYNREDFYSIGQIGLVKASKYYNKDKGSFSNYAIRCIKNEIFYRTHKKQLKTISLSTPIGDNIELEDTIVDNYSFENKLETQDFIEKLLEPLSKRERDYIISYYGLFGRVRKSGPQIAKELGISHQAVDVVIRRAQKKLREEVKKC